jgi:CubicO group peptidase (beta-lactamase class C family)
MGHSTPALSDAAAADVASGYRFWLLWPIAFDAPSPRRMTPAGFLISSAEDMAHYVAAELNGGTYQHRQLLSPPGIVTLHTPAVSMGPATSYGMGWAIRRAPGSTQIWHDGDVSNFHSHLRLLPDQHLGIVVLMNVGVSNNGAAIDSLVDGIVATFLGPSRRRPPPPSGRHSHD